MPADPMCRANHGDPQLMPGAHRSLGAARRPTWRPPSRQWDKHGGTALRLPDVRLDLVSHTCPL